MTDWLRTHWHLASFYFKSFKNKKKLKSSSHSPGPACKCSLGSGCMPGMLNYCVHLAWTQASRAWSIPCSTWVKVVESSPSLLRSPVSKHMVTKHLERVSVTPASWTRQERQRRRRRLRPSDHHSLAAPGRHSRERSGDARRRRETRQTFCFSLFSVLRVIVRYNIITPLFKQPSLV